MEVDKLVKTSLFIVFISASSPIFALSASNIENAKSAYSHFRDLIKQNASWSQTDIYRSLESKRKREEYVLKLMKTKKIDRASAFGVLRDRATSREKCTGPYEFKSAKEVKADQIVLTYRVEDLCSEKLDPKFKTWRFHFHDVVMLLENGRWVVDITESKPDKTSKIKNKQFK